MKRKTPPSWCENSHLFLQDDKTLGHKRVSWRDAELCYKSLGQTGAEEGMMR